MSASGICHTDIILVGSGGAPYPYTIKLPTSMIGPLLAALFNQFGAMGFRVMVAFTGHFGIEQTLILKQAALSM